MDNVKHYFPCYSTCLPGKKDVIKVDGNQEQRHILTDMMDILHHKLNCENPTRKISLATFKHYRPRNGLPVTRMRRNVALCKVHQNFLLHLAPLRAIGVSTCTSTFLSSYTNADAAEKLLEPEEVPVKLHPWKVVTEDLKGKPVNRTTLVEVTEQCEDFISNFKQDLVKFRSHHERVLNQ